MRINVPDGSFDVFVARPDSLPAPVVVVIQEIFGVNADIRETCEELARNGYIALAPDLFWRSAPGLDLNQWTEADWKLGMDLNNQFDVDCGARDIAATVEVARRMDGSSGKVGVMGFCLGGLMSFVTAVRTPVDAAVGYYGANTDRYLGEADRLASPLLLHFGDADEFIEPQARAKIHDALDGDPNVEIFSYTGRSHAFARHGGTHYDAEAAALANDRTYAFLERSLT